MVGGDVGPELTRIGNKVKAGVVAGMAAQSARLRCRQRAMPHYRFNDAQVATLTGFLLSQSRFRSAGQCSSRSGNARADRARQALVAEYGCASCHEINGIKKPENFAPELSRIGSKPVTQIVFLPGHGAHAYRTTSRPRSASRAPSAPALKMPQYTFTPAQIDALTTALLALTDRSLHAAAVAWRCRRRRKRITSLPEKPES